MWSEKKLTLKLDENEKKFPIEVLNIFDLTELEIIGGDFSYISEFINHLTNLKKLSIVSTKISDFPKEVFELPNLRYLSLKNNRIKSLPHLINPNKLETLILNKNYLTHLNFLNKNFSQLNYLDVGSNLIIEIPESISQLTNLKRINLENNNIYNAAILNELLPSLISVSA
jgi:Leucine-rich repeat (LRR) protein